MSKFQIVLLAVFGVFILVAVVVFSLYRSSGSSSVAVTIWGDIPASEFNVWRNSDALIADETTSINYVEKSSATLETEFTEALAEDTGPDLIILSQDQLWKNKSKIFVVPYDTVTERDFKATFVEEGELFLGLSGIYALPLSVDPLVLYYNRDLLSAAAQANPITYWDEMYVASTNLSKRDTAGNLISSIMALGEARNIPHAKEVLSLLMLQAGTPIISISGGNLRSELSNNFGSIVLPGESALSFYTQFSNPTKTFYSWNRSLLDAQTHFASGDSAYYLGFASELKALRSKNPTLNFGVALVPQSRVSGKSITFGNMRGVAISKDARDYSAAFSVATRLVSRDASLALAEILGVPPPRRDLLTTRPASAISSVFYDAAIQSRGWLDPDRSETRNIFNEMIESVTSGRARTSEALNKADREINALVK